MVPNWLLYSGYEENTNEIDTKYRLRWVGWYANEASFIDLHNLGLSNYFHADRSTNFYCWFSGCIWYFYLVWSLRAAIGNRRRNACNHHCAASAQIARDLKPVIKINLLYNSSICCWVSMKYFESHFREKFHCRNSAIGLDIKDILRHEKLMGFLMLQGKIE